MTFCFRDFAGDAMSSCFRDSAAPSHEPPATNAPESDKPEAAADAIESNKSTMKRGTQRQRTTRASVGSALVSWMLFIFLFSGEQKREQPRPSKQEFPFFPAICFTLPCMPPVEAIVKWINHIADLTLEIEILINL